MRADRGELAERARAAGRAHRVSERALDPRPRVLAGPQPRRATRRVLLVRDFQVADDLLAEKAGSIIDATSVLSPHAAEALSLR